jgi:peptidyl-prolyl cis-trans isomerase SurA
MKKIACIFLLLMFFPMIYGLGRPTGDPVLLRVGEREITRSEFVAAYLKNNVEMQVAEPKTIEEYLELYIDFNLKVQEAMALGLDTLADFRNELNNYRRQLARPYFRDESMTEKLVREAYDRMMYDIRAAHILITLEEHAPPSDTIEAYNRIMEIRQRYLDGEPFGSLAVEYSDDDAARDVPASGNTPPRRGNQGDLGYFTVFNMIYPFETAAYTTAVGEVSMPVRTRFGYHLVKVINRLPAVGTARVAHIMVMTPRGAGEEELERAEKKIREVYDKVLDGADFEELALQYSEDQNSAQRGGEMAPFQSNRMVPEFIEVLGELENPGDISPPVRTLYGWHIIKLLDRILPGSFEEMQADIAARVGRDTRGQLSEEAVVRRLKENYSFGEDLAALQIFHSIVDENFYQGDNPEGQDYGLDKPLFWFGPHVFYQKDFAGFLRDTYAPRVRMNYRALVNESYTRFVNESLISYEDSFLESKYPEFKAIMKEYHDGILLFEITDRVVWSQAVKDTVGLNAYFEQNQNNYYWEERLHVNLFSARDEETAIEAIGKLSGGRTDYADLLQELNAGSGERISAQERRLQKGDHPVTEMVDWKPGVYGPLKVNGQHMIVQVNDILPPRPREKSEIRGLLIADYQNHLEKKWVRELRDKYEVFVNEEVLKQIQINH